MAELCLKEVHLSYHWFVLLSQKMTKFGSAPPQSLCNCYSHKYGELNAAAALLIAMTIQAHSV